MPCKWPAAAWAWDRILSGQMQNDDGGLLGTLTHFLLINSSWLEAPHQEALLTLLETSLLVRRHWEIVQSKRENLSKAGSVIRKKRSTQLWKNGSGSVKEFGLS